jgi:type IV fimbrial biogenesis protein FimT
MKKVKGFTLVELLMTLAILSIIVSLAAPTFAHMVADNKIVTQHNRLVAALSLTRSEAIKRGQRVTLCQSADMNSCTKDSAKWHEGWVIFVDNDKDNRISSGEPILRVQQAITNMNISFGARTRIAYKPSGFVVGGSNGTFLFCDHRGESGKKGLIISNSGRARLAKETDLTSKPCPQY